MTWWHYLLLSNLYLILFYGFYVLFLRRETFFQLNRIYLVSSAVMSFLIPLIQSDLVRQWFITQKVQQTIYSASPSVIYQIQAIQPSHVTMGQVLGYIYLAGIAVLSLKLLWQLVILDRFIRNGAAAAAWSFFKKIKVDASLPDRDVIMAHEEVHARQWHSADVLLVELVMIINWFNPVVYLYRRSIKNIHEYIADRDALKSGTSRSEYALLLVSQTFDAPVHHLLNPFFNRSVLKQRIMMLHKNRSGHAALIKYGFSAPLFALMLVLSSATINNSKVVKSIHKNALTIFEAPSPISINESLAIQDTAKEEQQRPYEELSSTAPGFKMSTDLTMHDQPVVIPEQVNNDADTMNVDDNNEVFTSVEKLPEFPGGVEAFYKFLAKNLKYPSEARQSNAQGRANVTFIVKRDGSLSDIKPAGKVLGSGLTEEAIRVIRTSPKWIPGLQNGRTVDVQYTVPVVFTMLNDTPLSADTTNGRVRNITFLRRNTFTTGDSVHTVPGKRITSVVTFTNSRSSNAVTPLILIDGKEAPSDLKLTSLPSDKIVSIHVYKRNDPSIPQDIKADRDVVSITLKKEK